MFVNNRFDIEKTYSVSPHVGPVAMRYSLEFIPDFGKSRHEHGAKEKSDYDKRDD